MALPRAVTEIVAEASGRRHRADPVLPGSGGPAGNARLTAWVGLLLLVLVLAQLVTVLDVQGLISWHVVLGALLVPVALLKTGSTSWRVVRYYTGHRPYVDAGPPPTALRVLGPLVVLTTLGLLGSGVALILLGPTRGRRPFVTLLGQSLDTLTLHQVLFIGFCVAAGLHLLTRIVPAVTLVAGRVTRTVPGRSRRLVGVVGTLVAAALVATLLLADATGWQHDDHRRHHRPPGAVAGR